MNDGGSYKRTYDYEVDGGGMKRSRNDDGGAGDAILKILLPGYLTGQVIGKQGVVLNRIMDESGAKCRVSLMDEVLPVTGERICTVQGGIDAVCRAQQLISAQLAEPKPGEEPLPEDAERHLKIFVPNHGAGVVIGRSGSVIKEIMVVVKS